MIKWSLVYVMMAGSCDVSSGQGRHFSPRLRLSHKALVPALCAGFWINSKPRCNRLLTSLEPVKSSRFIDSAVRSDLSAMAGIPDLRFIYAIGSRQEILKVGAPRRAVEHGPRCWFIVFAGINTIDGAATSRGLGSFRFISSSASYRRRVWFPLGTTDRQILH